MASRLLFRTFTSPVLRRGVGAANPVVANWGSQATVGPLVAEARPKLAEAIFSRQYGSTSPLFHRHVAVLATQLPTKSIVPSSSSSLSSPLDRNELMLKPLGGQLGLRHDAGMSGLGAAIAVTALGGVGQGLGNVFGSLIAGHARNPSASAELFGHAMLGMGMIEVFGVMALGMAVVILFI